MTAARMTAEALQARAAKFQALLSGGQASLYVAGQLTSAQKRVVPAAIRESLESGRPVTLKDDPYVFNRLREASLGVWRYTPTGYEFQGLDAQGREWTVRLVKDTADR